MTKPRRTRTKKARRRERRAAERAGLTLDEWRARQGEEARKRARRRNRTEEES